MPLNADMCANFQALVVVVVRVVLRFKLGGVDA